MNVFKNLYELQKRVLKKPVEILKNRAEKKAKVAYELQKKIMKDVVNDAKKEAVKLAMERSDILLDTICEFIEDKIPFIGKYVSNKVRAERKAIIRSLFR